MPDLMVLLLSAVTAYIRNKLVASETTVCGKTTLEAARMITSIYQGGIYCKNITFDS